MLVAALLVIIIGGVEAAAQHPDGRAAAAASASAIAPPLAAKLKAPFHSAIAAKPLRETLAQIATVAEINYWLDRRVDPSLPVNISGGSQSVYQALVRAAEPLELHVAAAGNVVLVGRREWVRELAGAILALPEESRQGGDWPPIDWPAATTPDEALRIARGDEGGDTQSLPHDLWPAVAWRGVSPTLAALLIQAQFDRLPTASRMRPGAGKLTFVYPNGPHVPQMRQAAQAADSLSRFRSGRSGAPLELTGSPAAHLAAIAAYVSHPAAAAAVELDTTRFSLRLRDAPAKDVFAQLAATAGRQLYIAPAAAAACQQRVTLEGMNVTIAELTERIASEIGVQPSWTQESLRIEPAR